MAAKTGSRRPRRASPRGTPDLYARVLQHALEHPVVDRQGRMGFEVKAALGSHPISRVGLECRPRATSVLTLKDLVALVSRQRRLI